MSCVRALANGACRTRLAVDLRNKEQMILEQLLVEVALLSWH